MTWADRSIRELREGNTSQCRPHGGSMRGRIESGQLITLDPHQAPKIGDAVLCRVKGNTFVHLVKAVQGHDEKRRFLIGNNRGGTNGWTTTIYGVVTNVED